VPHKAGERRKFISQVAHLTYTLVFLESPYRVTDALADILSELGDRPVCVAREMTKMFEEFWRGDVSGALEYFKSQPARGEFTLVVGGVEKSSSEWTEEETVAAIKSGLEAGESPSRLSKRLAEESGWSKREIYRLIQEKKA
jgi:16S rRNA (cytidine1402-2'-O)-methyltransferase